VVTGTLFYFRRRLKLMFTKSSEPKPNPADPPLADPSLADPPL